MRFKKQNVMEYIKIILSIFPKIWKFLMNLSKPNLLIIFFSIVIVVNIYFLYVKPWYEDQEKIKELVYDNNSFLKDSIVVILAEIQSDMVMKRDIAKITHRMDSAFTIAIEQRNELNLFLYKLEYSIRHRNNGVDQILKEFEKIDQMNKGKYLDDKIKSDTLRNQAKTCNATAEN